ncbi:flagellar hook-associated protein 1 FlgK [Granulicella pectinivorans]|uniref:Flagellar hook-associated protein 1 n=1 Tax=Granulicella pectinivorans TaxID=474950 RepID=A0A1I6MSL4_9BACT|nr:flagellar hook-associated protein FlgK [Granulicella pectinivorans]SFS18695.1 flagellar hook-associated protein 1 FlgK [Granulicella pectinivorans]
MGTLSSLMDLTQSALQSNQAALDITSKNVANQNVQGYTRETVSWQADVVSINGTSVGTGVTTGPTAVSQRDRVLEQRVQQQTQLSSAATSRATALAQLQSIFGLSSSSTTAISTPLGAAIDSLYNGFSTLASSPASTSSRQAVLSAASTLASAFQSASTQITSTNAGLSQTATSIVSTVNGLTKTIATLNQQIGTLSPNADAGALEDQRQAAVAQLSQYIGLDQVTTESNGLTLSTSNGTVLVSGAQSFALSATTVGNNVQITGAGNATDISTSLTGGQLGGILSVQHNEIPALTSSLDQLAYAIGTAVNQQNTQGLDANGNAGQALFTLPATSTGAASSIAVATADPSLVAAAGPGEGIAGNTNANALAALATAPSAGGQPPASFFTGILSGLGGAAATATTDSTAQQASLTQLTTQRNALSGVSLDEEAASLTQYQRSYQAAAKLFSIVDTVMEAAINLGSATTI